MVKFKCFTQLSVDQHSHAVVPGLTGILCHFVAYVYYGINHFRFYLNSLYSLNFHAILERNSVKSLQLFPLNEPNDSD